MNNKRTGVAIVALAAVGLMSVGCKDRQQRLACWLTADKREYVVGEPIWITVTFENASDRAIYMEGGPYPVPGLLASEDGQHLGNDFFSILRAGGGGGLFTGSLVNIGDQVPRIDLAPHEAKEYRLNVTPNYELSGPGDYTVNWRWPIFWTRLDGKSSGDVRVEPTTLCLGGTVIG